MGRICGAGAKSPEYAGGPGGFAAGSYRGYWAGGVSTVSIQVHGWQLAVCTPPQTTLAPLTFRSLPDPVTVTVAPCTVLC